MQRSDGLGNQKLNGSRSSSRGGVRREMRPSRDRRLAEGLVESMTREARGRVVDLKNLIAGRSEAEDIQETLATRVDLAGFHPAHAAYVYAQTHVSLMSEQLTALDEMTPLARIVAKAEDHYMPDGPPMSPLTRSYFTSWAFFDACIEPADETIGTAILEVGAAFGMSAELLRLIRLMQQSRMGVYVREGIEGSLVVLREPAIDAVCRAIVPAGYRGQKGELWYARVLPPPIPGGSVHVVFTTPYILLKPGLREWQEYFRRTLRGVRQEAHLGAYERHLKYGPTRSYWNEFVFEAYVNHRTDAVYLAGLPDVPESRPHSEVNRRRYWQ